MVLKHFNASQCALHKEEQCISYWQIVNIGHRVFCLIVGAYQIIKQMAIYIIFTLCVPVQTFMGNMSTVFDGNDKAKPWYKKSNVMLYKWLGQRFLLNIPGLCSSSPKLYIVYQNIKNIQTLTHWGRVTHICVSELTIIEEYWSR